MPLSPRGRGGGYTDDFFLLLLEVNGGRGAHRAGLVNDFTVFVLEIFGVVL